MFNTPTDCYNYIIENDLEMSVLGAMMNHVGGYSIAEIAVGITGTTGNVDPNNADSMQGKVFFCILVGENAYDYEYNAEVTQMSRHEIKELYADKVFEELAKLINIVHSSSDLCCDSV